MSVTSDLLFAYLREIFYATPDAKLDVEKLEEDYVMFARGLMFFAHCFYQYNEFAKALAKGDLSVPVPPPENELAAPLKSLHASLKHLTWQSQRVATGDYKQRVDFMGEFADGFNMMVEQLADRQQKLEDEINTSHKHAKAMEQSNLLLSNLTHYIPQQIFVVAVDGFDILLQNDMAKKEIELDPEYIRKIMELLPEFHEMSGSNYAELLLNYDEVEKYLAINSYFIEWNKVNAVALVMSDVSAERKQLKELEGHAYHDALTKAFNRFYGMIVLNDWIKDKKQFALVFADMDSLKYVNDVHGHNEGDEYIIRVANHLSVFARDAVVCRLGGDEFMVLVPGFDEEGATKRIFEISHEIENDEYLHDKDYRYSISIGVVGVDADNESPAGEILALADERMYIHKRARKKERQANA